MKSILQDLRAALLSRGPIAALPDAVWKRTSAMNTWGTNAIEGNTLARDDVERLLLEERTAAGSPFRDVLETVQHDRAFLGLRHRLDEPVTARLAVRLHEAVFRDVKPHAGSLRLVRVGMAGQDVAFPRPEEVPLLLEEWERSYHQRDFEEEDKVALAAWMHWRFEAIHPFLDGNGRVGRLLLNFHLLKKSWPPVHVTPAERDAYNAALQAGGRGDLAPLVAFLQAALARSLLDLLDQVGTREDELAPLSHLARDGPYDAKYLALRASQGALPALKEGRAWRTSRRAVRLYVEHVGRG